MPTANHVLLQRVTLTADAATVNLASIPQTGYTDLKVVISARDTSSAGTSGNGYSFTIYPNGSSANITQRSLFGGSPIGVASYTDAQMYNVAEMNADTANTYSNIEIYISKYTSANPKSFSIDGVTETNGAQSAIRISAGLWNSTLAINRLQFNAASIWAVGSSFAVYGIVDTATTPVSAPKADGGDIIKTDGTYWYHAFLSSGIFKPQLNLTCDYLVVAGGGGGGNNNGGGGGAGGLRSTVTATGGGGSLESPIGVTSGTSYTITVGAGGASTNGNTTLGYSFNGTDSTFSTVTSIGGGGGGGYPSNLNGRAGGSGGGTGNSPTATAGARTVGQGYAGGTSSNAIGGGGGGGGAGSAGTNETGTVSGSGGTGVAIPSFASATGTGVSNYYAGGGGAGTFNGSYGTGGAGGGGNGAATGVAGIANTGGGGGGSGANSATNYSGAGGSGIVIIRYAV